MITPFTNKLVLEFNETHDDYSRFVIREFVFSHAAIPPYGHILIEKNMSDKAAIWRAYFHISVQPASTSVLTII